MLDRIVVKSVLIADFKFKRNNESKHKGAESASFMCAS
jgi:hypothetical protein